MSYMRTFALLILKIAACGGALALGLAMGRYTDIARNDLSFGPSRAHAAAPAPVQAAALEGVVPLAMATAELPLAAVPTLEQLAPPLPAEEHDGFAHELRRGRIMKGSTPHRLILFTFDDGPDRATTPVLLDRLDRAGIHAVFFLTGSNLRGENAAERRNQEIARETIERGHWVASHGMYHRQLPLLSDTDALVEVVDVEKVFERVLGQRPWLIRPPGGAHSPRIDLLLARRGYTTVLWNLGAGDYALRSAKDVHATWRAVMERREAQGERGGIVLLHDTYAWSVDAFQRIVDDLMARNCALLEQGEELYDIVDDPSIFFQPRADGEGPSTDARPVVLTDEELERRQAPLRAETAQRCAAKE
jgi:peptidoglycan/xylan/chitin deacetylase (PgdA/CDA1 family)